jgi:uncharacterized membrane protein
MLVAASLSPPAGLVGMAGAMSRWDMVVNGVFVLLLQLVGINLSASLVFRLYGLSAQGSPYRRGKQWVFAVTFVVTLALLASLLTWQFSKSPELQRSSREQRAAAEIQKVVNSSNLVKLVESNVRFTPANIEGQNTLLCVVYVQRNSDVSVTAQEIRTAIARAIQTTLLEQEFNVTPLVDIIVLEAPTSRR